MASSSSSYLSSEEEEVVLPWLLIKTHCFIGESKKAEQRVQFLLPLRVGVIMNWWPICRKSAEGVSGMGKGRWGGNTM